MSVNFDPFDPEVRDDPYPWYRVLRDEYPIYRNERRDFWAVSRFEDVQRVSRDFKRFVSGYGVDLDVIDSVAAPGNIVTSDPPIHERLRDIVRRDFAPKVIAELQDHIRTEVRRMLREAAEGGVADLGQDLALRLPFSVTSDLIGIPHSDREMLSELLEKIFSRSPGECTVPASASETADKVKAYFADLALARSTTDSPSKDVLQSMIQAYRAERLSIEEVGGMSLILLFAGYEATASLITNTLVLLHSHPETRAALAADSTLIPAAVEESLRFDSPVQFLIRSTAAAVQIHGEIVPAGARVALLYGAANRDERRFDNPDSFDIRREARRHLAFGEGIHFCLGAPLARLETRIVLEEILALAPNYRIVGTPERMCHMVGDRGFRHLNIDLVTR